MITVSLPTTYRPISLTSVCCKIMEHIIFHACMAHLENNDITVILHNMDLDLDTHVPLN